MAAIYIYVFMSRLVPASQATTYAFVWLHDKLPTVGLMHASGARCIMTYISYILDHCIAEDDASGLDGCCIWSFVEAWRRDSRRWFWLVKGKWFHSAPRESQGGGWM